MCYFLTGRTDWFGQRSQGFGHRIVHVPLVTLTTRVTKNVQSMNERMNESINQSINQ